jgi:predicted hotdog family 3-hydroxylacyl-ACP dehydratase
MILVGNDILQLIPQRPPVVMVDTLYTCDVGRAETGFTVAADNIFCENGLFSEGGIIENIAQTAASQVGYLCQQQNIPVPVGFIGAVKGLEIFALPTVGDRLHTSIQIEYEVMGVTVISGKVLCNDRLMATAEMKIVIKSE